MGERFLWGPVQAGWNHQIGHGHTGVKACGQVPETRHPPRSTVWGQHLLNHPRPQSCARLGHLAAAGLTGADSGQASGPALCVALRLVGCPQLSPGLGVGEGTITVWGYFLFAKHSQTAHEV